jgi:cation diffusion facilitator CzcD-associated flavoprotein CzcO
MLSDPNLPDWEGIDTFTGPVFHTSSYDHGQDLRGRRVAIVGTGSTACQLTPALAPVVGSLDLYQREPGYVLPKRVREIDADQHSRHRRYPILRRIDRFKLFMRASNDGKAIRAESRRQRELRQYCLRYIADTLADEGVRAAVTPSYAFGCKRPVLASGFYASLNEPHVNLVPHEVVQVTPKGLIDSTGAHREAEVLILATGFRPTQYLSTLDVRGRGGQSLQEVWNGEPSAFLGVTVPGFPNFFILYGPNTNGGSSVIAQLEIQAELVVRTIRRMGRSRANVVDTRSGTARRFDSWVQGQIRERLSALTTGCHNYYHTSTGKNVTQWPHSHLVYRALSLLLPYWGHVKKAEPSDGEAKSRAPNESTAPASAPDYRSASQLDSDRRTA